MNFIEDYVQNIPISFFNKLSKDDILFIDGSHVSKFGSDVNFILLNILPILQSGVIVHFHDIFLSDEYPKSWINEKITFWNEQYMLNAFLYENSKFEVLFTSHYFHKKYPKKFDEFYNDPKIIHGGGSFWIRKK